MEVIDGNWIKDRLTGVRGEKARLSEAMGITPQKLSHILAGGRDVQPEEVPKVLAFFNMEITHRDEELTVQRDLGETVSDVRLVSWVSAGQLMDQDHLASLEDFPSIHVADLPRGKWIALRVNGTSMNKLSPPESIIIVDLDDKRLINGKCYVVADETGAATYKAYDPACDPPFVPRSYLDIDPPEFIGSARVVGRVYRTMLDL